MESFTNQGKSLHFSPEKKTPVFINCVCLKGSDQRPASFQAVGGAHLHMDMLFINVLLFIKAGSPRPSAAQQGAAPARLLLGSPACPGTALREPGWSGRRGWSGGGRGRGDGTQARRTEMMSVPAAVSGGGVGGATWEKRPGSKVVLTPKRGCTEGWQEGGFSLLSLTVVAVSVAG